MAKSKQQTGFCFRDFDTMFADQAAALVNSTAPTVEKEPTTWRNTCVVCRNPWTANYESKYCPIHEDQDPERWQPPVKPATEPCRPEGCEHSDEEHEAFDAGVKAGEEGADSWDCPHTGSLREDWLTGHSVGAMNREADDA